MGQKKAKNHHVSFESAVSREWLFLSEPMNSHCFVSRQVRNSAERMLLRRCRVQGRWWRPVRRWTIRTMPGPLRCTWQLSHAI